MLNEVEKEIFKGNPYHSEMNRKNIATENNPQQQKQTIQGRRHTI